MTPSTLPLAGIPPATTPSPEGLPPGDGDLSPRADGLPWQPETLADVEWSLARLGEAEADVDAIHRQAQAAISAIEARRDEIAGKHERRAAWFRSLVSAWAETHRGEVVRGNRKTREFLSGSVSFRAAQERVIVLDPEAFIAWAQANHMELLTIEPRIDKKALSAFVKTTGEVPVGIDVEPATEGVTIKANPLPTLPAAATPKEIP